MLLNRRQFMASSSLALAAGLARDLHARGQNQTPPPTPRFEDVRRGVGIFTMRGGTIGYLLSAGAGVVIDSQYPDTAPVCLEGIRQRTSRPLDLLINTHHHADHTGGNAVFKPAVKRILAHARVPELQKAAAIQAKTEDQQAYPDVTFTNTWTEEMGGEVVALRHYGPAHTGGDAIVTFQKANVVHMGDLMFHHVQPRVDRPAGASVVNWATSLEHIVKDHHDDTVYIFGHARPDAPVTGRKADVLFFRDYLSAALDYVRKRIAAGGAREEFGKIDTLPGFTDFAPLGGRLTASHLLEAVFDELTAK